MAEHSDDMKAAIAAMRAEWAQIAPLVLKEEDPEMPDDERIASLARRSEMMREFWLKHLAALEAVNPGAALPDIGELDRRKEAFMAADHAAKEAEEALLHSAADVADAQQALVESMLEVLAGWEALTQEEWDAMEPAHRVATFDSMRELQGLREDLLEELPVARRAYWEKR